MHWRVYIYCSECVINTHTRHNPIETSINTAQARVIIAVGVTHTRAGCQVFQITQLSLVLYACLRCVS